MTKEQILRDALQGVVDHWTAQFERNGHLAPSWCKRAREALALTATGAADAAVRDAALDEAAALCLWKYHNRASSGHPREAAASRALYDEIRALKSYSAQPVAANVSIPAPWQDRMARHYAQGSGRCLPAAHFMQAEICDWRDTSIHAPKIDASGERVDSVEVLRDSQAAFGGGCMAFGKAHAAASKRGGK